MRPPGLSLDTAGLDGLSFNVINVITIVCDLPGVYIMYSLALELIYKNKQHKT